MMTDAQPAPISSRPSVSVVVPFLGDEEAAKAVIGAMRGVRLRPGDELILADNTPDGVVSRVEPGPVTVVGAPGQRSSYHARNVGAEAASGEWLLFTDADCRPRGDILDAFFAHPVPSSTGLLAGGIESSRDDHGLLSEWAASREILSQRAAAEADVPAAATACLLVRRSTWAEAGGFQEGVRSGADLEFCWRAASLGHRLEFRPEAAVEHLPRQNLRAIARQMARYAAGNAWQFRRYPDYASTPKPGLGLLRAGPGVLWFAITLRPRRAALKLIDGVASAAQFIGRGFSNAASPVRRGANRESGRSLVVATDQFPVLSETFVRNEIGALETLGWEVRVEAVRRPDRPLVGGAHWLRVNYVEDEGPVARIRAFAWLVVRHPLRSLADRVRAKRWVEERLPLWGIAPQARRLARGGESHVHVHFAALAAASALRVGRLVGVPVSFIGHGHELFVTPRALPQKVAAAAFAAGPCEYTTGYIRTLAPNGLEDRVRTIVMGIDGSQFRREQPYPGGRCVVAVGRLVEKKGFAVLIDAVARLEGTDPIERLLIAGEGPLRHDLERQISAADLSERIDLLGALDPREVRELMEVADLVAVPCVIAADGDRDAMPVVAKEALAMEIPVVASREVGLPEVISEKWGRLVAPGNSAELAAALSELLELPAAERAAMGAAGREFVLRQFSVRGEAERVSDLITAVGLPRVAKSIPTGVASGT